MRLNETNRRKFIILSIFFCPLFRPEIKEGKEAETEKKAEQENNESDKIEKEKELEKDKVRNKINDNNDEMNKKTQLIITIKV